MSPETCWADLNRLINEKVVASCWLFTSSHCRNLLPIVLVPILFRAEDFADCLYIPTDTDLVTTASSNLHPPPSAGFNLLALDCLQKVGRINL